MEMERKQGWKEKRAVKLLCGVLALFVLGLIYAWSIFSSPLAKVFPTWNEASLSLNFTISICFFCLGGFCSSLTARKTSIGFVLKSCAILLFVGFMGVSFLPETSPNASLVLLYLFYGVLTGFGVGFGYNAILASVTPWFPGKSGIVSGVLLMGFGIGGMLLGSAVGGFIAYAGVFLAFRLLAVVSFLIVFACSFFIAPPQTPVASDAGQARGAAGAQNTMAASEEVAGHRSHRIVRTDSRGDQTDSRGTKVDFTPTQMLKTRAFWMFQIWNITLAAAGLLVINSAAQIAVSFGAAAMLGLVVSLCNGAGRVIFGGLFDRIGRGATMTLNVLVMALAGVCLLIAALTGNAFLAFVGLIGAGLAYGGDPTALAFYVGEFYGQKHYGINLSVNTFSLIPAALIGPFVSGVLQVASRERLGIADAMGMTPQAYFTTFVMMLVFCAISLLSSIWIQKPKPALPESKAKGVPQRSSK